MTWHLVGYSITELSKPEDFGWPKSERNLFLIERFVGFRITEIKSSGKIFWMLDVQLNDPDNLEYNLRFE